MTVAEGGRTVVVPQADGTYDRRLDPSGEQKNAGVPQALYLENVFPTSNGYQSVGFIDSGDVLPVPATRYLFQVIEIKAYEATTTEIVTVPLFCYSDDTFTSGPYGQSIVTVVGTAPLVAQQGGLTIGIVGTNCYLFSTKGATNRLYEVTYQAGTDQVTLTEVTASVTPAGFCDDIQGITSSNNYLIAHGVDVIYWSSTTNQLDFVPSLVTGAGSESPNDADSDVNYIKSTAGGFYIYTSTNILYAQYTGNARYPWKFAPVLGTNTVKNPAMQVYGDPTSPAQYVIESQNQIKILAARDSRAVASEATDYLTRTFSHQVFNSSTNTFSTALVASIEPKIYTYLNRYVLISVNGSGKHQSTAYFTHVIVFDSLLQRYGRIKLDHTYVYTLQNIGTKNAENLVFVEYGTNALKILHFDIYESDTLPGGMSYIPMSGVFILGKLQYVRSRMLCLESVEIEGAPDENLDSSPNFSCVLLPSLDGRNFDAAVSPTTSNQTGDLSIHTFHHTAKNHSIVIKGAFALSTIECHFVPTGGY